MDWLTIGIIALAVVVLILLYNFTGAGTAVNCLMRHKSQKNRRLKDAHDIEEDAGK